MKMYTEPQELNAYLDRRFLCDCGQEHYAPLKAVRIRRDALEDLPKLVKQFGFQSVFLICDSITYEIAGAKCLDLLAQAKIRAKIETLNHIAFDEATVGELTISMPRDCDLVVAVGTGSINDMARFFSYRMGRPFFTVATAAPMDGFASSIAALNVNNLKTTFEAQTPTAIIGDTEILKNAPDRLIAAGLGDLLGKFTCLCDWKLSRLITGEHYCRNIARLVENCVQNVLKNADKARERDPQVLGGIMEGLVLAGVAMSLNGNSRPASGCEHHMSHYWEMMFEQRGERPAPHGTQVSVGTVLVLRLVEALKGSKIDFDAAREAAKFYDPQRWKEEIRAAYGPAAEGVIAMEREADKNGTAGRLRRIDVMQAHWEEILEILNKLPASAQIIRLLKSLDAPYLPEQIGIDPVLLKNTFLYCKEVRNRYTILQMAWDLNLLDSLSDQVIANPEPPADSRAVLERA